MRLDVTIKLKELRDAIAACRPFVSKDENYPRIFGVLFEGRETGRGRVLNVVSTNGHVLSKASLKGQNVPVGSWIVPASDLAKMPKTKGDVTLEFNVSENGTSQFTCISGASWSMAIENIDEDYADYEPVIPKRYENHVKVDAAKLSESLKRLLPMTTERRRGGTFDITSESLTVSVPASDVGEAETEISANLVGQPGRIGLDLKHVLSAIKALHAKGDIVLSYKDALSAITITRPDKGGTETLIVIAPMRI